MRMIMFFLLAVLGLSAQTTKTETDTGIGRIAGVRDSTVLKPVNPDTPGFNPRAYLTGQLVDGCRAIPGKSALVVVGDDPARNRVLVRLDISYLSAGSECPNGTLAFVGYGEFRKLPPVTPEWVRFERDKEIARKILSGQK